MFEHPQGVKRNIVLADQTGHCVTTTLWNAEAESFSAPVESIVAIKSARVSDFGGTRTEKRGEGVSGRRGERARGARGWVGEGVGG